MYEAIRKLYQCGKLPTVEELEENKEYKNLKERMMQVQVLLMKALAEKDKALLKEYMMLHNTVQDERMESAYIDGYLWGSQLTSDTLGKKRES